MARVFKTKTAMVRAFVNSILVIGLVAASSATTQSPQRDAAAIGILYNAVAALGGPSAVAGIQDCTLAGLMANQDGTSLKITWTIAGSEFRIQTTAANGKTNVFLSGHGFPAWITNGNVSALKSYVARANLPFYLPPYVLWQELVSPIYTLKYVGLVQLNGATALQVHISDDSDPNGKLVTPQEWYFDPVSFLPLRVQYRVPTNENPANHANATFDMGQFTPIGGVLIPFTVSYSQDNAPTVTVTIGSATINSGVSQSVFDPPQGGGQ
jgi:hypothetical protein